MANKTITQLDAAQSLNDNMVIAVQDTNTTYKTTLADVKAYCGGGSTDKYKVGDRVTDDSDNPVGTVSSIFTDGNGDRYAVVCLDAVNRLSSDTWIIMNTSTIITDLPIYNQTVWGPWEAKETATFNTQKILDFCTTTNDITNACTYCRSKFFTIDGNTYYGQLPNIIELYDIVRNHTILNTADPTASNYSSVNFSTGRSFWSSTQYAKDLVWAAAGSGGISQFKKSSSQGVIPVLEIPLDQGTSGNTESGGGDGGIDNSDKSDDGGAD